MSPPLPTMPLTPSADHSPGALQKIDSRYRSVEAEGCYWAVLDISAIKKNLRGRGRHQQLGYLFESQLPVPIETVLAAYLPLGPSNGDQVLACGIDKVRFAALIDHEAVTLCPARIPPELKIEGVNPADLNLLVGDYLPRAVRRSQRLWVLQTCSVAAACFITLLVGVQRRTAMAIEREMTARKEMAGIYRLVLPPETGPGMQPEALRATAELRRLRMTRQGPAPAQAGTDASLTLSSILAAWPKDAADLRVQAELLTATEAGSTLRVIVPGHEQAQRFQDALNQVAGLKREQPQISTQRDSVRIDFRLTRVKENKQ